MNFFARLHPFVLLMYFVAVLSVSMFMQHPIYLTLSFLGGVGFLVFLKGIKYVIKSLATFVLLGLIITLTNPLFSHNGATPLFFINGNAFTLEALVYGGVFALLIICVIFWFSVFNQIFDSEKILFLFGRISPKISLIFSMALNFIPNFTRYFKEILAVQKVNEKSKIKLYISCFSAVITHSLEEAIETADSMTARGYGIGKATCFSRFSFKRCDVVCLILITLLTAITYFAIITEHTTFMFYPIIACKPLNLSSVASYVAFGVLCFTPTLFQIKEDLKWKYSISKI